MSLCVGQRNTVTLAVSGAGEVPILLQLPHKSKTMLVNMPTMKSKVGVLKVRSQTLVPQCVAMI